MSECQSLQSGKKWRMEMSKMSIYSNTIYEKKLEYFELHYPQNSFLIDMTLNSYRKVELGKWIHRKTSVWNVFIPRNQWIFRNEFPSIIWLDFPISEHIKSAIVHFVLKNLGWIHSTSDIPLCNFLLFRPVYMKRARINNVAQMCCQ